MNKKLVSVIVVIIALVAVVGVCFYAFADDDGDKKDTIRVGYCNKVCYEVFMIADKKGFFDELSINVETIVISGGGTDVSKSLLTGNVDLAAMGDTPAVQNLNSTNDTSIVCRYGYSEAMHAFVARAGSGIDSNDLKTIEGKKVGIQKGSSTEGAFLDWLAANGVDSSKVNWVYLKPSEQVTALSTSDVDMIASSQPNPQNAMKLNGSYLVGTSEGLGNYYPLVLLGSNSILSEKSEAVFEIIEALNKATEYMNENPEECAQIAASLIGTGNSWTLDDELKCMGEITWDIGFNQDIDVDSLYKTAEVLRSSNQDISQINFWERYNSRFVDNL